MPQIQLPIFPIGSTHITSTLAFVREGDQVTYFNGSMPVFTHAKNDMASFKMITAQFYLNGNAKQAVVPVPLAYQRSVSNERLNVIRSLAQKDFMHPEIPEEPAY